ncbi:16S rRNA processing protein RimM [Parafrankia irregularis]|uniref:Ribosome maturation factor RimM n=1 Tax=Parafrankia irregularis TaxID=795642 RepID=A0A0S4QJJ1_9ACTN|nr:MULTISPECIES: ribosome maturation factor RimM [Parafrankia]MBE3205424.1 ribosome maturation factor RimM [Parafrankia sp. CH37]CUU55680.1 16S rRNA processing protein RimM [Parafrankia irregularis]
MGEPVIVGRVGRPHGVRGDVTIDVRTDLPERRFAPGSVLGRQVAGDSVTAAGVPAATGDSGTGNGSTGTGATSPLGATATSTQPMLRVVTSRWHSGRLLVRFDGVGDRNAAEALRGTLLTIDSDESGSPAEPDDDDDGDLWWDRDLVGLRAQTPAGEPLGDVIDVIHSPAGEMLAISRAGGGEHLIPFVREIVPTVDLEAGHIVVDPPPGLLDLD